MKILDMMEIEKKSYAELAMLYGKNVSSIHEVMKNKETIRASFSVAPQNAKVTAIGRDKVLMKFENALNFWVEKHDVYCLRSALMEKHDFYCLVTPLKLYMILYTTGNVSFHCSIVS
jgi:hypothetical protein